MTDFDNIADRVLAAIQRLPSQDRQIVTIAGESASGKSTLARNLARRRKDAAVIHQDAYFHLPPLANHQRRLKDPTDVGPQEVDLGRLQQDLDAFIRGDKSITIPAIDREKDQFVSTELNLSEVRMMIVEGTYVTQLSLPAVHVFMTTTYPKTVARQRERDRDPVHPQQDTILRLEKAIIQQQKSRAHILVDETGAVSMGPATSAD